MWHSGVKATRPDHAVIDPIINDLIARAKFFGHLADGQLFWSLELRCRNPVSAPDPLDNLRGVGQPFCAYLSLPIELVGDFSIGQVASQSSNFVNHRRRIAHAVGYIERELYRDIATGAALPPVVSL